MEKYIGSKIVDAEPSIRAVLANGSTVYYDGDVPAPEEGELRLAGYKVRYEDGYESWSPKEVFEAAYRRTDGLSFGLALEAAKKGFRIARQGWNGKGQYVELGVNFRYEVPYAGIEKHVQHLDMGSQALVFVGTRGRQVGWLASQADMLADDWQIIVSVQTMGWEAALEAVKAGAAVRRMGWEDGSWVAILEEPAELKGKICKVCPDTGDITPDWKPEGEDLKAGDWHIMEV